MSLEPPAEDAIKQIEPALPESWRWLVDHSIAGNNLWRIAALAASIAIALFVGRLARQILGAIARRLLAHGRQPLAAASTAFARSTGFVSFVFGLTVGLHFLRLSPTVDAAADTTTSVLWAAAIGYVAYCLVDVAEEWLRKLSTSRGSKMDDMLVPIVTTSLRVTVAVLTFVQISTILSDKPVTSIIAGLGVGGLAVGLAAQDTIKNFFGSLMLFSDRPFELGDEIKVGDIGGTVEAVGFRSTRFRTADGFQVTIPNGDLASKTIVNISRRSNLGRQFNLPLARDLAPEKIERATAIVSDILHNHEGMQTESPPRIFFNDFAPDALNLSIAYWYAPPDWWRFVAFNERVNLEILRRFAAEGIALALTTRLIRLQSDDQQPKPTVENAKPDAGKKL